MRLRRAYKERSSDPEPAGTYAVHAIGRLTDETHAAALALVDELIAMAPAAAPEAATPRQQDDLQLI
jgi:hypothetical protein